MNKFEQIFQKELQECAFKPRLLLHACCAPCCLYPLKLLIPHFKITIYYGNSNIYPLAEYQRRLATLADYL